MRIYGNDGASLFKTGCGGLQGDATFAQIFGAFYDPMAADWIATIDRQSEQDQLSFWHPITEEKINAGCTLYADDPAKTITPR